MISELTKSVPLYDGKKVTREEYMNLPSDGFSYDMIDGVLHLAPSPFSQHSYFQTVFLVKLGIYLDSRRSAKLFNELDVYLPDGGDTVRPDITVVLNENRKIIDKWIFGTPDLVCEVLSESTRAYDLGKKADRYLLNGIKEFWIVEPETKRIQVWKNRTTEWKKETGKELASEILTGFSINTEEFFS